MLLQFETPNPKWGLEVFKNGYNGGGEGGVALSGTKFFNIISGVCHTG